MKWEKMVFKGVKKRDWINMIMSTVPEKYKEMDPLEVGFGSCSALEATESQDLNPGETLEDALGRLYPYKNLYKVAHVRFKTEIIYFTHYSYISEDKLGSKS